MQLSEGSSGKADLPPVCPPPRTTTTESFLWLVPGSLQGGPTTPGTCTAATKPLCVLWGPYPRQRGKRGLCRGLGQGGRDLWNDLKWRLLLFASFLVQELENTDWGEVEFP